MYELSGPLTKASIAATTSPLQRVRMLSISCRLRLGNTFISTSTGDFCKGAGSSTTFSLLFLCLYLYLKSGPSHLSSSLLTSSLSFIDRFSGVSEGSCSSSSSSTFRSWSDGEGGGGVEGSGLQLGVFGSWEPSVLGDGLDASETRARFWTATTGI